MNSILPDIATGLFFGFGGRGLGKTTFCVNAEIPSRTCLLDYDDGKGKQFYEMLKKHGFVYYDVMGDIAKETKLIKRKPDNYYAYLEKFLNSIKQDQFNHVIIDNIDNFQKSLYAEVKKDPKFFNLLPTNVEKGTYGGATPGVNEMVSGIVSYLHSKGVQLVSVTSHVTQHWAGGVPVPNKFKPRGVEAWQRMSVLTLAFFPGKYAPIPSAVVHKAADVIVTFNEETNKYENKRRLPYKLPRATWDDIKNYLYVEYANLENPKDDEVPTEEEISIYSEKLSREQLAVILAEQKKNEREEAMELATIKALQSVAPDVDANDKEAVKNVLERAKLEATKLRDELGPKGAAEKLGITIPELMKRISVK